MPLFMDGARLGYGLTAAGTDVTLPDLAHHRRRVLHRRHQGRRAVRRGRRLHQGQYAEAFSRRSSSTAHCWPRLAGPGFSSARCSPMTCTCASQPTRAGRRDRIREALRERGYTLTFEAPTNQVFIMDHPTIERLQAHVRMGFMEKADNEHTVMRLCTN